MLKVNVKQISNEGTEFSGKISSRDLGLAVSNSAVAIKFDDFIEYQLYVSCVSDGILVAGKVKVGVKTDCVRCLAHYNFILEANDVCHFYEHVKSDELDITEDIREDLLISLPSKFLCGQECSGLCPSCGKNLNNEKCDCTVIPETDDEEENPWSALDKLDI